MEKKKFTYLRNPQTDREVKVRNGFAWTVALFGPIALAIRGQWLEVGISIGIIALVIILDLNIPDSIPMAVWIGYAMVANEMLLKQRQRQGYEIIDDRNEHVA